MRGAEQQGAQPRAPAFHLCHIDRKRHQMGAIHLQYGRFVSTHVQRYRAATQCPATNHNSTASSSRQMLHPLSTLACPHLQVAQLDSVHVQHGEGVGGGQAQQAQNLEHLDGGDLWQKQKTVRWHQLHAGLKARGAQQAQPRLQTSA